MAKKKLKKITLVSGDDWQGLYIDGKLAIEGHSVSVEDVLLMLDINHETLFANDNWLDVEGYLPEDLKDVKLQ